MHPVDWFWLFTGFGIGALASIPLILYQARAYRGYIDRLEKQLRFRSPFK
jgi:hypothetical protein